MAQTFFSGLSNKQILKTIAENPTSAFGQVERSIEAFGQSRDPSDLSNAIQGFKRVEAGLRGRGINPADVPQIASFRSRIGGLPDPFKFSNAQAIGAPSRPTGTVPRATIFQREGFGDFGDPVDVRPEAGPEEFGSALTRRFGSISNIPGVISAGDINANIQAPDLPDPQSLAINESLLNTSAQNLASASSAFEKTSQAELKRLKEEEVATDKTLGEFETLQQENLIGNIRERSQPFRQKLIENERQRLSVEANFAANQQLTSELGTLLTEGNDLIAQQKGVTGLASIRNPRIAKTIQDVQARAGVIQAVMAARNNQITMAERLIDNTVAAVNADRVDALNYYGALNDFYEKNIVSITKEKKAFVDAQIDLNNAEIESSRETADNIKEAMIDPDTAGAYAEAGITLNDTVEEINEKLARHFPRGIPGKGDADDPDVIFTEKTLTPELRTSIIETLTEAANAEPPVEITISELMQTYPNVAREALENFQRLDYTRIGAEEEEDGGPGPIKRAVDFLARGAKFGAKSFIKQKTAPARTFLDALNK